MLLHLWQNFERCGILCITPRRKHDIFMVLTKSHFTFHAIFRLFFLKYMSQSNIHMASIELWAIWQVVCFLMLWHERLLVLISADIHIALVQSFLLTGQCSNFTHSLNTLFYAAATGYSLQIMLTLIALPSKLALNTPPLLKQCLSPSLWRSACWKKRLQDRWIRAEIQMNYTWLTLQTESV